MPPLRVGTSGWVYNHWRGVFYPQDLPPREWFDYYARHFDTVEINNSFYRLPSAETFDSWREQAPPGFLYAVKASRYLTHLKKLKDPEEPLQIFYERANQLGRTLGPVLYQLPPHWHINLERLDHFLSLLPAGHTHIVEFRDESWLIEPVFQLMERYHVAHCLHDMSPLRIPLRITAPPVYIRFHGDPEHGGNYGPGKLRTWAERITTWQRENLPVFVYFNNDPSGYAVQDALLLRELLGLTTNPAE